MCRLMFCGLLLLPSISLAQPASKKIDLQHHRYRGQAEEDKQLLSQLADESNYREKKVKKIEVFDSLNQKYLTINFDRIGGYSGWTQSGLEFEHLSYKKGAKQISEEKLIFQSKVISKTINKTSSKKILRYGIPVLVTKSRYITFDMGSYVNQRNASYNEQYLNLKTDRDEKLYLNKKLTTYYPNEKLIKRKNELYREAKVNYDNYDVEANIEKVAGNRAKVEQWIKRHTRASAKYYVEGERLSKMELARKASTTDNNYTGTLQNTEAQNRHILFTKNKAGLKDSLFILYVPPATQEEYEKKRAEEQTKKEENLLIERQYKASGLRSDLPQKTLYYTFRYEYFDE